MNQTGEPPCIFLFFSNVAKLDLKHGINVMTRYWIHIYFHQNSQSQLQLSHKSRAVPIAQGQITELCKVFDNTTKIPGSQCLTFAHAWVWKFVYTSVLTS